MNKDLLRKMAALDESGAVLYHYQHRPERLTEDVQQTDEAQLSKQDVWDKAIVALSPVVGDFIRDVHSAGKMGPTGWFVAFDYKGSEYSVEYDARRQSYAVFKDRTSVVIRTDAATAKKTIQQLQGLGEARPWTPFASTYYYHRFTQRDLVGSGSTQEAAAREIVRRTQMEARGERLHDDEDKRDKAAAKMARKAGKKPGTPEFAKTKAKFKRSMKK